ncbi:hypothetical protein [Streptomyces sp. 1114.5]|uniref:hypothetical protein n=1 Tax=Streptomyces sp. 1114.5 TaxID=1938830 RepID=UPI0011C3A929|nr:hypothetical protein [Streptomyces sp. 1114.5]
MMTEPLELYERLRADSPADYRAWIAANVPADTHLQAWGAVNDLLKTDAIYALADPDNHPRGDFDRAVEFVIAGIESGRIPAFMGVNWLGVYVTTADRFGWTIEHSKLSPDNFGRRILACLPLERSEASKLAERLRIEGRQREAGIGLDLDTWSAMRSVRLELEWAVPRIKDLQLATTAKEWLELICHIDALIDRTS